MTRFSPALSKSMVSLLPSIGGDAAIAEFLVEDALANA